MEAISAERKGKRRRARAFAARRQGRQSGLLDAPSEGEHPSREARADRRSAGRAVKPGLHRRGERELDRVGRQTRTWVLQSSWCLRQSSVARIEGATQPARAGGEPRPSHGGSRRVVDARVGGGRGEDGARCAARGRSRKAAPSHGRKIVWRDTVAGAPGTRASIPNPGGRTDVLARAGERARRSRGRLSREASGRNGTDTAVPAGRQGASEDGSHRGRLLQPHGAGGRRPEPSLERARARAGPRRRGASVTSRPKRASAKASLPPDPSPRERVGRSEAERPA